MYPYTTSSSTTTGGVAAGLGIPPSQIDRVIGIAKVIQSHVGDGPFVTEIRDKVLLKKLHGNLNTVDAECGTTTGRVRRLGYFDLPGIRRAIMVNGVTEMAITKLDWLSRFNDNIPVCTGYRRKGKYYHVAPDAAYKLSQSRPDFSLLQSWSRPINDAREFEDLPYQAQDFVKFIEEQTQVPITMIGVGPRRDEIIFR